ncbi:MT-A70 family methyltransferase [Luteipulveratus mongoliensis]|uniref:MT-A70 family methyltransferase n=1 Tax=Luteipulveratus mongoliensis TaxID=571913 RepID=UPI0009F8CFD9|nr:MT-A70 family methyltransferase [Luteipulveratus mongoliensis]
MRYRTILADPPWDIQQRGARGAVAHYNLMSLERIKAMPVADLAADDAHLWLWVTNATLRHGYDVAEAWGFTVRSPLTWVKFRLGLGNYLRNSTEHLLFATKGDAPVAYRSQPTWIQAPVQDHSHKPEEQYALIERISPGPYLELFARRPQPGWDAWGNEIDSDLRIAGYPVPGEPRERSPPARRAASNNEKQTTSNQKGGSNAREQSHQS